MAEIEKLGATVGYGDGGWLHWWFGDSFAPVYFLNLQGTEITNAVLADAEELTDLHGLVLNDTQLTDDQLQHVTGLTKLSYLGLSFTQVTDAGLQHCLASDGTGIVVCLD